MHFVYIPQLYGLIQLPTSNHYPYKYSTFRIVTPVVSQSHFYYFNEKFLYSKQLIRLIYTKLTNTLQLCQKMDMQQYHCELPRLTLHLEVRNSCFNHHCLASNLTLPSRLNGVYKRYIRLIPNLYVLK